MPFPRNSPLHDPLAAIRFPDAERSLRENLLKARALNDPMLRTSDGEEAFLKGCEAIQDDEHAREVEREKRQRGLKKPGLPCAESNDWEEVVFEDDEPTYFDNEYFGVPRSYDVYVYRDDGQIVNVDVGHCGGKFLIPVLTEEDWGKSEEEIKAMLIAVSEAPHRSVVFKRGDRIGFVVIDSGVV